MNEPKKVRIIYSDREPPCVCVHGARGGPTQLYDFRIEFYSERRRLPEIENITENGKREVTFSQDDQKYNEYVIVDRKPETSVILSFRAAKELAEWLTRSLKEVKEQAKIVENIQKQGKKNIETFIR